MPSTGVVGQVIGRWDDFNFLRAFHEAGALRGFVTDLWWPENRMTLALESLLPEAARSRLLRCRCKHLPSRLGHIDPRALAYMVALQIGRRGGDKRGLWRRQGKAIGRATARLARRAGAKAVFAHSYYANWTFDNLDTGRVRLLHQVHPYGPALERIYTEEIESGSLLAEDLRDEIEMAGDSAFSAALAAAPLQADAIVAASQFTRSTLVQAGVVKEKVTVIPYGVDLDAFVPVGGPRPAKPTVLFVGRVSARKGIGYLLEAWKRLKTKSARLVLVGSLPDSARLGEEIRLAGAEALGRVPDAELVRLFQGADLFCLPSIAEGFGLVLLQSLACGTPILGTTATAAVDIVARHPDVGFVAPSRSIDALATALDVALTNLDGVRERRAICAQAARDYSWEEFRGHVRGWFHDTMERVV